MAVTRAFSAFSARFIFEKKFENMMMSFSDRRPNVCSEGALIVERRIEFVNLAKIRVKSRYSNA